jgi:hypothetical protein
MTDITASIVLIDFILLVSNSNIALHFVPECIDIQIFDIL